MADDWTTKSRGFVRREGTRRRNRGRREINMAATTMWGRESRGRGPHPWRTSLTTTRYTVPSPPDRVLLILTPKTMPSMTITKRGPWWE